MLDWSELLKAATGRDAIGRDASALRQEEWQAIDEETIEVVRVTPSALDFFSPLIDRRFQGAGWTEIKTYKAGTRKAAVVDMSGDPIQGDYRQKTSTLTPVPIVHAESLFKWRMVEQARTGRIPFETEEVAEAGVEVLTKNDSVIYAGDADLGLDPLLAPTGRTTSAGTSWATPLNAYNDISAMSQALDDLIGSGGVPRVLFVNSAQALRLRAKNTGGEGGTPLKDLIDVGVLSGVDAVRVTPFQTAGKALLMPMSKAYAKIYVTVSLRNEEIVNPGRDKVVSTWNALTTKVRVPEVFIEKTGLT
jgi:uncharacterized linocin/CFP29 family protein